MKHMGKRGIGANQLRQFDWLIPIHEGFCENKAKTCGDGAINSQVFWEFMGGLRKRGIGTIYSVRF